MAPAKFVLVLPGSASAEHLAAAARLYPFADIIRSRPLPMTVTKERSRCL